MESLSEAGKKDKIFSDRSDRAEKFDKHDGTTGLPLGTLRSPRKR